MSCESDKCSTHSNQCGPQHHHHEKCEPQSCCPLEKAVHMWDKSFCEAMRGVMVDLLKEEIKKSWGSKMTREAKAVLNAKEAQWNSMLAAGKAKHMLKEELMKIMTEA